MSRDWEDTRANERAAERQERLEEARRKVKRVGLGGLRVNEPPDPEERRREAAARAKAVAEVTDENWDGDEA